MSKNRFIISISALEIEHVYNPILHVLDKDNKSSLPIPLINSTYYEYMQHTYFNT